MLATLGDLLEDVAVHPLGDLREATDTPCVIRRRRGGSAANVAVAAAKVLGIQRVRFLGRVGADALGDQLLADLREAGVEACVQRGGRTGCVVLLVGADGERTMLTDRGSCKDLEGYEERWLNGVGLLHVPGYSLLEQPLADTAKAIIDDVRVNGGALSVDASSVGSISDAGLDDFCAILAELDPDVLICNRSEADMLDAAWAARELRVRVTKDGPRPTVLSVQGFDEERIAAPPLSKVTDTTGAGDAFAGGLLAARLEGADWSESVKAAHRSAKEHLIILGSKE